jgi:hypothetical protein
MQRVMPFVDALKKASNLSENQAKTVVYYCIMTWSDKPRIRPLTDLHGESGSGKNAIMKQVKPWCNGSKWINARNKTAPQIRDDLANTTTAFIEEADKTREPKLCENWYQQRYDETGKDISYRKQGLDAKGHSISIPVTCNHFGYTFLHSQNQFESIELDRRMIRILLFKDLSKPYGITQGLLNGVLQQIANQVDWSYPMPQSVSNSAWDVWLPLMMVAVYLGDSAFLTYALDQIERKTEEDGLTKVFESKGVVLSEIAAPYIGAVKQGKKHIAITTVRQQLKNRGYEYSERQIVKAAKELGFGIAYPHNKAHIKIEGEQVLRDIAARAGVGDDLFANPDANS